MVREEYESSAAQLLPEVSSGPNHGSHFQEKRREVFLFALQQPGGVGHTKGKFFVRKMVDFRMKKLFEGLPFAAILQRRKKGKHQRKQ